jgi:hypothetical protein
MPCRPRGSMELRHLRYFMAVAEAGAFSRAAARPRITQPALWRQVHDLEAELGVRLFERAGRTIRLTSAGEGLLGRSRELLDRVEQLAEHAHAMRSGEAGTLRVGGSPQVIQSVLAPFLARYLKASTSLKRVASAPRASSSVARPLGLGAPAGRRSAPRASVIPRPCHGRSAADASSRTAGDCRCHRSSARTRSAAATGIWYPRDVRWCLPHCSRISASRPRSRRSSIAACAGRDWPRYCRRAIYRPVQGSKNPRSATSSGGCIARHVELDRLGSPAVLDRTREEFHRGAGAT